MLSASWWATSQQDLEVTRRVVSAGKVLGVPLVDHVVVGTDRVVSLRELGEVPITSSAQANWAA
jgi:DNA repair protein RadC